MIEGQSCSISARVIALDDPPARSESTDRGPMKRASRLGLRSHPKFTGGGGGGGGGCTGGGGDGGGGSGRGGGSGGSRGIGRGSDGGGEDADIVRATERRRARGPISVRRDSITGQEEEYHYAAEAERQARPE